MTDPQDRVLVAILNNPLDLAIAHSQGWYRIPVGSMERFLKKRWPPQWLAFYQTKVFADQAYAVNYFAQVCDVRLVPRWQLFPDEPRDEKSERYYYQLVLSTLRKLPHPIVSRRWRRITFIPTKWDKFISAVEINDLYDESPLEDLLWKYLKHWNISAERQELVQVKDNFYALDFAIYCAQGNIDVETDGNTWHADPERIPLDNQRDVDLVTAGWDVLRFNTKQIQEDISDYCLPKIIKNVNRLGGIEEGKLVPRKIDPNNTSGWFQPSLFNNSRSSPNDS
jgi:very-short-patch-repair endonuclease